MLAVAAASSRSARLRSGQRDSSSEGSDKVLASERDVALALITVYKSLGGGWSPAGSIATPPDPTILR